MFEIVFGGLADDIRSVAGRSALRNCGHGDAVADEQVVSNAEDHDGHKTAEDAHHGCIPGTRHGFSLLSHLLTYLPYRITVKEEFFAVSCEQHAVTACLLLFHACHNGAYVAPSFALELGDCRCKGWHWCCSPCFSLGGQGELLAPALAPIIFCGASKVKSQSAVKRHGVGDQGFREAGTRKVGRAPGIVAEKRQGRGWVYPGAAAGGI